MSKVWYCFEWSRRVHHTTHLAIAERVPVGADVLAVLEVSFEGPSHVLHGESAYSRAGDGVRRRGEHSVDEGVWRSGVYTGHHV